MSAIDINLTTNWSGLFPQGPHSCTSALRMGLEGAQLPRTNSDVTPVSCGLYDQQFGGF